MNRKSAPGVRDGRVQKKNWHDLSPDFYEHEFDSLVVKRLRPAKGYYHSVSPNRDASNGEPAAIAYELRRQKELADTYFDLFGVP